MVQLSSCCCFFSLTQGTVGTGIVSAIESILCIWMGRVWINSRDDSYFDDDEESKSTIFNDAVKGVLHTMGVVAVVIGTLLLLTSIILFCAVLKKKRSLIMPWFGMRGIMLGFQICAIYPLSRSGLSFLYILGNIAWFCLMAPADTARFQLVSQNPENPHQPPDGEPNYSPRYYPIPNPTGQQSLQPMGAAPDYPASSTVPADKPKKSAIVWF